MTTMLSLDKMTPNVRMVVPYSIKVALLLKAKLLNKDSVLAFNFGMGGGIGKSSRVSLGRLSFQAR